MQSAHFIYRPKMQSCELYPDSKLTENFFQRELYFA